MNEDLTPPSIQPTIPEPPKEDPKKIEEEKKLNRNPLFLGLLVVVILFSGFIIYKMFLSNKVELDPSPTKLSEPEKKEQNEFKPIEEPKKEEPTEEPAEEEEPEEEEEEQDNRTKEFYKAETKKITLNGQQHEIRIELYEERYKYPSGDLVYYYQNVYFDNKKFINDKEVRNMPLGGMDNREEGHQITFVKEEFDAIKIFKDTNGKDEYLIFELLGWPSATFILNSSGNVLVKKLSSFESALITIYTNNTLGKSYFKTCTESEECVTTNEDGVKRKYFSTFNNDLINYVSDNTILYIDAEKLCKDNPKRDGTDLLNTVDIRQIQITDGKVVDTLDATFTKEATGLYIEIFGGIFDADSFKVLNN